MDKSELPNKNLLIGGLAGGLIGAAAALLLAPKSGTDLVKELVNLLTEGSIKPKKGNGKKKVVRHAAAALKVSKKPKPARTKEKKPRKSKVKHVPHSHTA